MYRLRLWVEHFLNPMHAFCRCMDFLVLYDKLWRRIFGKVPLKNSRKKWVIMYRDWGRIRRQISEQLQKKND